LLNRRKIIVLTVLFGTTVSFWLSGCMPDSEVGGIEIPNALPTTEISSGPPSLLDSGFSVDFHWTGFDSDNLIIGYQWKMSNNGLDGIDVADTLTFDPATGDTLNPWHFITSTDTTFLVSADIPNFPNDPEGRQRSYQVHTLFVRAVDEAGGVDNTPAHVSFTSTTVLPTISLNVPYSVFAQTMPVRLPSTVTFGWEGEDSDFDAGIPTHIRTLWGKAYLEDVGHISNRAVFIQNMDELVDFSDSNWTEWEEYHPDEFDRRKTLPDRDIDPESRWFPAHQKRDTCGAVSIDRTYGINIAHVKIDKSLSPSLTVYEPFLGVETVYFTMSLSSYEIAAGQKLNFSWVADADEYAGVIDSYRYGWDVVDPNDPDDPGWAILPGLGPDNLRTLPTSFESGIHSLTVQVLDNSGLESRLKILLDVVPVPALEQQKPLLLIDDVFENQSQRWPDVSGSPRDSDVFRDAFWLGVCSRVNDWLESEDSFDTSNNPQLITYRLATEYRVLLWTSKHIMRGNKIASAFRPLSSACDGDQMNWLATYQERAGNLFLVSSRALNQFLAESTFYMTPIIFDTRDEIHALGQTNYIIGFGECPVPDGSMERHGLTRYPYRFIGVSMIDAVSPQYHIYDRQLIGYQDRKSPCAGAKGLLLNEDFRQTYLPDGGIQEVILTNTTIDWQDNNPEYYSDLINPWPYGNTEFYDTNLASRPASAAPQMCGSDVCIDPMFEIYARYNWIRDQKAAAGDPNWPGEEIDGEIVMPLMYLDNLCGEMALTSDGLSAQTQKKNCGFVTHKVKELKPSQKGDVIWGFDAYRFNHDDISDAIYWVLGEHFGLIIN